MHNTHFLADKPTFFIKGDIVLSAVQNHFVTAVRLCPRHKMVDNARSHASPADALIHNQILQMANISALVDEFGFHNYSSSSADAAETYIFDNYHF